MGEARAERFADGLDKYLLANPLCGPRWRRRILLAMFPITIPLWFVWLFFWAVIALFGTVGILAWDAWFDEENYDA